jgi:hypothetical protein
MSAESVVIAPVSFMILVICVFSFLLLLSVLLEFCQIYWCFQKIPSVLLTFLFQFYWFLLLIMIISSPPPVTLDLFYSFLIGSRRGSKVTDLRGLFSFLIYPCGVINSPFSAALSVSYTFWYALFKFLPFQSILVFFFLVFTNLWII